MARRIWAITGIIVGAVLAMGPLWGLIGTMVGMVHVFSSFGRANAPDAETIAGNVDLALWTTLAGFIACPFGIALLVISGIALFRMPRQPAPGP